MRQEYGLTVLGQLKPLQNPFDPPKNQNSRFEKDPFARPGDLTPNDYLLKCPICHGNLPNDFISGKCTNCKNTIQEPIKDGIPEHAPDPKSMIKIRPPILPKNIPINSSKNVYNLKESKKNKDLAKHDEDTIKDEYTVEFDQCMEGKRKQMLNDDIIRKDEIMKSCLDLAIDG